VETVAVVEAAEVHAIFTELLAHVLPAIRQPHVVASVPVAVTVAAPVQPLAAAHCEYVHAVPVQVMVSVPTHVPDGTPLPEPELAPVQLAFDQLVKAATEAPFTVTANVARSTSEQATAEPCSSQGILGQKA